MDGGHAQQHAQDALVPDAQQHAQDVLVLEADEEMRDVTAPPATKEDQDEPGDSDDTMEDAVAFLQSKNRTTRIRKFNLSRLRYRSFRSSS